MKKEKKKPKYNLWQNIKYYFGVLRSFKSAVLFMVFAGIPVAILATIIVTYTPKIILEQLEFSDTFTEIGFVIVAIFVARLMLIMVKNGIDVQKENYTTDTFSYFSTFKEKKKLFLDYEYLEEPQCKVLMSKADAALENNHTKICNFPSTLADFIQNIVLFVFFGSVLSTLHPVVILLIIASTFAGYIPQKLYREYEHRTKDNRAAVNRKIWYFAGLSGNFSIAKDVRLFGMKDWMEEAATLTSNEWKKLTLDLEQRGFYVSLVGFFVTLLRDGAAYAYLIYCASQGEISSGDFVLYFSAIGSFGGWFSGILSGWSNIHSASMEICDYREFLELPDKFNHGNGVSIPEEQEIEIKLEDVSFTYPSSKESTLEHINLLIHPGEKLAVVGLNGAGKTTLVKLICGLYTPTQGRILVNGHEINEYNREEYYSIISAVFQHSSILPISIAENIASCKMENIDWAKLKRAVELAGFDKKAAQLPEGIRTSIVKSINPDGVELSGGEKQRMLLARAIYKDAKILILDEPTSALDPIAESKMYECYKEFAACRTSVFISHRLVSTRFCDRIILLDGKRIAEEGTHDELVKSGGKYAELFELQSHYYKEEVPA